MNMAFCTTIQIAKKYANSVKGIWITVLVGAMLFGLCHVPNLFFGMNPLAVFSQVTTAIFVGLLFGAVYLRSGSIWVLIFVHALTDTVSLAKSTLLVGVADIEVANDLSFSWELLFLYLFLAGLAAFLLRPSKCKQVYESLCFADKSLEDAAGK